jgi:hypothetical protein
MSFVGLVGWYPGVNKKSLDDLLHFLGLVVILGQRYTYLCPDVTLARVVYLDPAKLTAGAQRFGVSPKGKGLARRG